MGERLRGPSEGPSRESSEARGKNSVKHLPEQQSGKPLHECRCQVCLVTKSLETTLWNSVRTTKPVPRKWTACTANFLSKLIAGTPVSVALSRHPGTCPRVMTDVGGAGRLGDQGLGVVGTRLNDRQWPGFPDTASCRLRPHHVGTRRLHFCSFAGS